ncbi:MAG: hypothetical protein ABDH16_05045 [Thermodesulfovibrionaceae bacterium]
MTIEIIDKKPHARGIIYTLKANGKILKILLLFHAIERIKKWQINAFKGGDVYEDKILK